IVQQRDEPRMARLDEPQRAAAAVRERRGRRRGGGQPRTRTPFGVDWMHGHFDFLTMRHGPRDHAALHRVALRQAHAARFVMRARR
ncbi:hypothetical protein, partial [Psychrobacter sp. 16-MNA-CIBAN-0192]|uniref:hypothetical protein n=1 Tax=Psychrobacter sp. 16-MNA-CIBAN-0192 TaxID=3140448 RepID=UPI003318FE2E